MVFLSSEYDACLLGLALNKALSFGHVSRLKL